MKGKLLITMLIAGLVVSSAGFAITSGDSMNGPAGVNGSGVIENNGMPDGELNGAMNNPSGEMSGINGAMQNSEPPVHPDSGNADTSTSDDNDF